MSKTGYFTISLDFELYWGMCDAVPFETYKENIAGVHQVVPQLLELFTQYEIHATWATVGMLMYTRKEDLLAAIPPDHLRPEYARGNASSYKHLNTFTLGENEQTDPYHFAPSLVQKIISTPGQELASHTFSHFYCIDNLKTDTDVFGVDCGAMQKAADRFGIPLSSIVFPRNQITPQALETCKKHGLIAYRGNQQHFLYSSRAQVKQRNPLLRILRLVDAYLNISGTHTYDIYAVNKNTADLINIPASRFLRPYSPLLRVLERMRLRRITAAMTRAAKRGEVFHLWWHPHNFGAHTQENMQNLRVILEHYATLAQQYGMESRNMGEIAQMLHQ